MTGEMNPVKARPSIVEFADEFVVWDRGVNMDTFYLFKVAVKAWELTHAEQDALVLELDARGII